MQWLNYHHLYLFWTVAKEGSIAEASKKLRLSQPTISVQLKALEDALGEQLFERSGRRLVLSDVGRVVEQYANEIFSLGRELTESLRTATPGKLARLRIGVSDAVPKLVTHRLLRSVLDEDHQLHLSINEDKTERLMLDLAAHHLDLVLCDAPMPPGSPVRAYNHFLGESSVSFFAAPEVAKAHRRDFPASLAGAPLILPFPASALRRELDQWFDRIDVQPRIVAEVEDSGLVKLLGQHGHGIVAAASILERDIRRLYGLDVVGSTDDVQERFYAVTVERRITHPSVVAICRDARTKVFAGSAPR